MINDAFDQIFVSEQKNGMISERSSKQKPPPPQKQNGPVVMTDKSHSNKGKKINLRSFNSKSIEIKKSLSISNEKSKHIKQDTEDDLSVSRSEKESYTKDIDDLINVQNVNLRKEEKKREPGSPGPFASAAST